MKPRAIDGNGGAAGRGAGAGAEAGDGGRGSGADRKLRAGRSRRGARGGGDRHIEDAGHGGRSQQGDLRVAIDRKVGDRGAAKVDHGGRAKARARQRQQRCRPPSCRCVVLSPVSVGSDVVLSVNSSADEVVDVPPGEVTVIW